MAINDSTETNQDRPYGTHETPPSGDTGSSDFRESPDAPQGTAPITKSATHDFASKIVPPRALKRTRTGPADARPRGSTRASPLLGPGKKHAAGTRVRDRQGDIFQYNFDPMTSDWDSESSRSSEDEAPEPAARRENALSEESVLQQEQTDGSAQGNQARRWDSAEGRGFMIGNDFMKTKGRVSKNDGRLKISINETVNSGYLAKALGQGMRNHLNIPRWDRTARQRPKSQKRKTEFEDTASNAPAPYSTTPRPRLNVVIMVIGSRGDIQPFLKIGKILRDTYGHRVRVASHPVFRDFVEMAELEFFSVGGDPSELMSFMVRNPGLIPNIQTLREGEIQKRRASMAEMFEGFWRASISTTEGEHDKGNLKLMKEKSPFVADAIIANPPSMAHVHIAERLGIPLHMMFTFPYTPTTQFPHPLANIKMRKSNVDAQYVNFMSYPLVEMMTWQGLGDIVNRFREHTLQLEPVSSLWAPGALYRMKVPYTYLWSPSLVPKPKDWGPEIDLSGFVFLELAKHYEPPRELTDFLNAGDPPVYIGFGSIVVDDPDRLTDMIFEAVEMAGVRALVNKGWGGLGRDNGNTPKNIYMLDNTPHDWLFPKVKAVVHHGGAGTTAIGLKCAKPTMIVPFFGDQPFWGAMVAKAKAGAHECIPYKKLTAERLAEGIKQCLTEAAQQNVQKIADRIAKEGDGAENAVKSFHRSLPLAGKHSMRCSILQERVAVWKVKRSHLRLSALAAQLLHEEGKIKWSDLKLQRHYHWNDFDGPGEPFTGGVGAITDSLYGIGQGFGMVPVRIARHIREREEHERRKRARQKRKEDRERKVIEANAKLSTNQGDTENVEGGQAVRPRPSVERVNTNTTLASTISADPSETLPHEVIEDLQWGLKRAGVAVLTMPNDLAVAIAQGLHNAPRLWGDTTVRKPVRITGVKSGFTAARKEFGYGIYDGWTGLVKQPKGDWEDGENLASKFAGLGTGFGKGLGGFVLKNANAVFAPPAFIVQGLIKHVEKHSVGPGSKAFIRRSHFIQGENDLRKLTLHDKEKDQNQVQQIRERVDHGWAVYEEIWNRAYEYFGPVGASRASLMGKYKLKKEKKKWDINGALENVNTADQALQAQEKGHLQELLAQLKVEMRVGEQPRTSTLQRPESSEQGPEMRPTEQKREDSVWSPQARQEEPEFSHLELKSSRVGEEMVSRSNRVASSEDGTEKDTRAAKLSAREVHKRPIDDPTHYVQSVVGLS